jgi:hypothetical protein
VNGIFFKYFTSFDFGPSLYRTRWLTSQNSHRNLVTPKPHSQHGARCVRDLIGPHGHSEVPKPLITHGQVLA